MFAAAMLEVYYAAEV